MSRLPPFDKYDLYQRAVQSPDVDARFFYNLYRRLRGKKPVRLREDFCGTFANLCAWVKLGPRLEGIGVDLDEEPLEYGYKKNACRLTEEQRERLTIYQGDVLRVHRPQVDLIMALNFSFYGFHERETLLAYFRNCRSALRARGLFVVDCFGGSECQETIEDRSRKRGFWYFWEQTGFDPIHSRAKFHIHFKRDGERRRERVFTYDWRMWTIPEIRELMLKAGFRKTLVYWEGDDHVFRPSEKGEPCAAWIAYVVGLI